uniref:Uncharacterized protein n=1 Tax=Trichuris muris TaxID=70415 RepID=A0A5S6R010_TRIMR
MRALELCDEEFLDHELKYIERVQCQNGTEWKVTEMLQRNPNLPHLLLSPLLLLIITKIGKESEVVITK